MANFTNKDIAHMLKELASLMAINGDNKYRIRAYRNAARSLGNTSRDIARLVEEDNLTDISGIGEGIADTIRETFSNGYCPPLEELKAELPAGVLELINIPGLGPKRAHKLFYELGIENVDELKKALDSGEVRNLKGFGPKSEEKLLHSLKNYEQYRGKILLSEARGEAEKIIDYLQENTNLIDRVEVTGSTRRGKEIIGDIDILICGKEKEKINKCICNMPEIKEIIGQGETKTSLLTEEGLQVDFRIIESRQFPAALQYFTGSQAHNVKVRQQAKKLNFKLNEYGLFVDDNEVELNSEKMLYNKLNMDYIIPELREDRGEIEAALNGELPDSIQYTDIRGDLHTHSRDSDGAFSIAEMVAAARERNYDYLAITDHSESLRVAHGLSRQELRQQIDEIDNLQSQYTDFTILKGIEVDILKDGTLDYSDDLLARLDVVIASIHTGFSMNGGEITDRILKAMDNPHVDIIGHPQGRLLGQRKAYRVDMDRVIEKAAKTGTCLEINSSPHRLDLDDKMVKVARDAGVKVVINTDAHHINELDDILLGVKVARRGWLEKDDVLNCKSSQELLNFFRSD